MLVSQTAALQTLTNTAFFLSGYGKTLLLSERWDIKSNNGLGWIYTVGIKIKIRLDYPVN